MRRLILCGAAVMAAAGVAGAEPFADRVVAYTVGTVDGAAGRCGETAFLAADCIANTGKGKIACK
jgi:hypothetical protein